MLIKRSLLWHTTRVYSRMVAPSQEEQEEKLQSRVELLLLVER
jgi:hypothetical protein